MNSSDLKGQRLAGLCMLGFVLFNFPVLSLFNQPIPLFGIPLVYAYIFAAWALLVALMAMVVEADDV